MADEVKETISNFNLKDGLSIDEAKVSALILCLVICFIFVLVKYQVDGDISDNIVLVFQTLVAAVAGVNIANKVTTVFKGSNKYIINTVSNER